MNLTFEGFFSYENLYSAVATIIVVVVVLVVERVVKKAIRRVIKKSEMEEHIENILIIVSRIVLYSLGITFILGIWGMPTEWFISVSALSGAAIGFASAQTVGNLLAGLYVMVARPFLVKDYVRIGSVEGEVTKITLNYVNIYAPTYTIVEIPNSTVLNSTISRLVNDNMIDYSFSITFADKIWAAAWVSSANLFDKILNPAIEDFWTQHKNDLPRKPEISISSIGHMSRTVMFRTFFPRGNAKLLYDLQPELQKTILKRLDEYRIERDKN